MGNCLIINFHGIGTMVREPEPGEADVWVTEEKFEEICALAAGRSDIIITFDDGNSSDMRIALPVLQKYNLKALFFILAGRLGEAGSLSVKEVKALQAAGMGIGSHGMDHKAWNRLSETEMVRELESAKSQLEEIIGKPITEAACPFGRYNRKLLKRLRQLGYKKIYTSDGIGANPDSWFLPRYSIHSWDSAESVKNKLREITPLHPKRIMGRLKGVLKRLR